MSGAALTEGIEQVEIDGVKVPVFSTAKTVAYCFKYRNKVGLDVALEALRDGWSQRKLQVDIGLGDAVTPAPETVSYPVLLEDLPAPATALLS